MWVSVKTNNVMFVRGNKDRVTKCSMARRNISDCGSTEFKKKRYEISNVYSYVFKKITCDAFFF